MSLRRLNYILMRNVLPFNYGMDYSDWCKLYQSSLRDLVGSDPSTWTPQEIDEVNRRAAQENELLDRLMSLPDAEFYTECDRLAKDDTEEAKSDCG